MTDGVLKIGSFSRLTGIPITALRYYDEIGLLRPAVVDPDSGFRLYGDDQLETGRLIARLRSIEMPPEDVAALLRTPENRAELLAGHRRRLLDRVNAGLDRLGALEQLMSAAGEPLFVYRLSERWLEPVELAGLSRSATIDQAPSVARELIAELAARTQEGAAIVVVGPGDQDDNVLVQAGVRAEQATATGLRRWRALGWHAIVADIGHGQTDPTDALRAIHALASSAGHALGEEIAELARPISGEPSTRQVAWRIARVAEHAADALFMRKLA